MQPDRIAWTLFVRLVTLWCLMSLVSSSLAKETNQETPIADPLAASLDRKNGTNGSANTTSNSWYSPLFRRLSPEFRSEVLRSSFVDIFNATQHHTSEEIEPYQKKLSWRYLTSIHTLQLKRAAPGLFKRMRKTSGVNETAYAQEVWLFSLTKWSL